ncbi:MAG TPA: outer membrane beta-barrel family protein, partial [Saprospiraceae bacterium]|nr:outer membrane beta-barrel family protein [Saprospiraceae bacterium]
NDNPSSYDNTASFQWTNTNEYSKTELNKTTPIHILVGKADYEHRISPSVTWQAGIKSVTSTLDNNVLVERIVDGVSTTDHLFTSSSTLNERIYAGYASTHWHIGKQVQIDGGLRYEYTHTSISSPGEKNLIERKYGYFFPSLSARKNLASEKDLEFSYTRRITRPTYNDIAPYVFLWGPSTFSAGNTSLYPALSDALSVGYHVRQWTVSLQYSHIRNEITMMQPEVDGENTLIYRSQNLKHLNTWGLTLTNSSAITSWWEIQSSLTAQQQSGQTSYLPNNVMLHLFSVNINMVNQFKLPKDFAAEISFLYQSKSFSGMSQFLPLGYLNAGIQKNFGKQGIIRLSMDDILSTNNWRIET